MSRLNVLGGLVRLMMPAGVISALYAGRLAEVEGRRIDPKAQALRDLVATVRRIKSAAELELFLAQLFFENPFVFKDSVAQLREQCAQVQVRGGLCMAVVAGDQEMGPVPDANAPQARY